MTEHFSEVWADFLSFGKVFILTVSQSTLDLCWANVIGLLGSSTFFIIDCISWNCSKWINLIVQNIQMKYNSVFKFHERSTNIQRHFPFIFLIIANEWKPCLLLLVFKNPHMAPCGNYSCFMLILSMFDLHWAGVFELYIFNLFDFWSHQLK